MTSNQIVGIAFVVAGLSDVFVIAFLRGRMPPERARTFTTALAASAFVLVLAGIVFLVKR